MKKLLIVLLVLLVPFAAFAGGQQEGADDTQDMQAEEMQGPADGALGSEENPIVWSFVPSGETGEIVAGGEQVAELIFEKTGIAIDVRVATEYAGVVEALSTDPPSAQMASLNTFGYIVASQRGVAEPALVAVRFGSPSYNGQIIARSDSGITEISDLSGRTFGRPDPLSTSGWIIPSITMRAEGIDPEEDLEQILDAGGHGAVVTAVYNGDVDAGATYVDARGEIEEANPDVNDVINVIAISEDIPNDGVQFHPSVPAELREPIVEALLEIAEENTDVLQLAYSWTELVPRGDEFYAPFRQQIEAAGIDPEQFL
jgi:phosphonate transport system substrate-binding protein